MRHEFHVASVAHGGHGREAAHDLQAARIQDAFRVHHHGGEDGEDLVILAMDRGQPHIRESFFQIVPPVHAVLGIAKGYRHAFLADFFEHGF